MSEREFSRMRAPPLSGNDRNRMNGWVDPDAYDSEFDEEEPAVARRRARQTREDEEDSERLARQLAEQDSEEDPAPRIVNRAHNRIPRQQSAASTTSTSTSSTTTSTSRTTQRRGRVEVSSSGSDTDTDSDTPQARVTVTTSRARAQQRARERTEEQIRRHEAQMRQIELEEERIAARQRAESLAQFAEETRKYEKTAKMQARLDKIDSERLGFYNLSLQKNPTTNAAYKHLSYNLLDHQQATIDAMLTMESSSNYVVPIRSDLLQVIDPANVSVSGTTQPKTVQEQIDDFTKTVTTRKTMSKFVLNRMYKEFLESVNKTARVETNEENKRIESIHINSRFGFLATRSCAGIAQTVLGLIARGADAGKIKSIGMISTSQDVKDNCAPFPEGVGNTHKNTAFLSLPNLQMSAVLPADEQLISSQVQVLSTIGNASASFAKRVGNSKETIISKSTLILLTATEIPEYESLTENESDFLFTVLKTRQNLCAFCDKKIFTFSPDLIPKDNIELTLITSKKKLITNDDELNIYQRFPKERVVSESESEKSETESEDDEDETESEASEEDETEESEDDEVEQPKTKKASKSHSDKYVQVLFSKTREHTDELGKIDVVLLNVVHIDLFCKLFSTIQWQRVIVSATVSSLLAGADSPTDPCCTAKTALERSVNGTIIDKIGKFLQQVRWTWYITNKYEINSPENILQSLVCSKEEAELWHHYGRKKKAVAEPKSVFDTNSENKQLILSIYSKLLTVKVPDNALFSRATTKKSKCESDSNDESNTEESDNSSDDEDDNRINVHLIKTSQVSNIDKSQTLDASKISRAKYAVNSKNPIEFLDALGCSYMTLAEFEFSVMQSYERVIREICPGTEVIDLSTTSTTVTSSSKDRIFGLSQKAQSLWQQINGHSDIGCLICMEDFKLLTQPIQPTTGTNRTNPNQIMVFFQCCKNFFCMECLMGQSKQKLMGYGNNQFSRIVFCPVCKDLSSVDDVNFFSYCQGTLDKNINRFAVAKTDCVSAKSTSTISKSKSAATKGATSAKKTTATLTKDTSQIDFIKILTEPMNFVRTDRFDKMTGLQILRCLLTSLTSKSGLDVTKKNPERIVVFYDSIAEKVHKPATTRTPARRRTATRRRYQSDSDEDEAESTFSSTSTSSATVDKSILDQFSGYKMTDKKEAIKKNRIVFVNLLEKWYYYNQQSVLADQKISHIIVFIAGLLNRSKLDEIIECFGLLKDSAKDIDDQTRPKLVILSDGICSANGTRMEKAASASNSTIQDDPVYTFDSIESSKELTLLT